MSEAHCVNTYAALKQSHEELVKALEEAQAWLCFKTGGRTPAQNGAKCATSFEAWQFIDAALAHAKEVKP